MFVLCAVLHFVVPFILSFYPPLVNLETDLKDVPLDAASSSVTTTSDEKRKKKVT